MRKLMIAACLAALAAPAAAQPGTPDFSRNLPRGDDIEAMAPALDRSVDALLELDVGPIMDAADPFARHPGYGRHGRTLREMGRRRDPYFEQRLRGSIYRGTAQAGRMMDAFSAAMPAMQRSLDQLQASLGAAIDDYHRRAPDGQVDDDWDREFDDEYLGDEGYEDLPDDE